MVLGKKMHLVVNVLDVKVLECYVKSMKEIMGIKKKWVVFKLTESHLLFSTILKNK